MKAWLHRGQALVSAAWLGLLLTIGLITAPAAFAVFPPVEAGRYLSRVFAVEAYVALAMGLSLLLLARRDAREAAARGGSQFSLDMALALGTLLCTVLGYFAVQPLMAGARAGQGGLSFGQLHAVSLGFYAVKVLLVAALAWRLAGRAAPVSPAASS